MEFNDLDDRRKRLIKMAGWASLSVAISLILLKTFAWFLSDAVSLLSALGDSVLDAGASLINLLALRQALSPADEEHRYGHGKMEALSGLAQGAFITGSAAFLLLQGVERLFNPRPVEQIGLGLIIMGISTLMTLGLVLFLKLVIRQTDSLAVRADALHYESDLILNLGVMLSLFLVRLGWDWVDPIIALLIAAWILRSALSIARGSLDVLMDKELPEEQRQEIRSSALSCEGVLGLHDLRTRRSGALSFVELHVEMEPELPLREAHKIAEAVMEAVRMALPGAQVLVHQDPQGVEEGRLPFED